VQPWVVLLGGEDYTSSTISVAEKELEVAMGDISMVDGTNPFGAQMPRRQRARQHRPRSAPTRRSNAIPEGSSFPWGTADNAQWQQQMQRERGRRPVTALGIGGDASPGGGGGAGHWKRNRDVVDGAGKLECLQVRLAKVRNKPAVGSRRRHGRRGAWAAPAVRAGRNL